MQEFQRIAQLLAQLEAEYGGHMFTADQHTTWFPVLQNQGVPRMQLDWGEDNVKVRAGWFIDTDIPVEDPDLAFLKGLLTAILDGKAKEYIRKGADGKFHEFAFFVDFLPLGSVGKQGPFDDPDVFEHVIPAWPRNDSGMVDPEAWLSRDPD